MVNATQSSARRPFDGCVDAGGSGLRLRVHSSRRVDRSVLRRDLSHERGLARGAPASCVPQTVPICEGTSPGPYTRRTATQRRNGSTLRETESAELAGIQSLQYHREDVAVTARRGHRVYAQTSL